MFPWKSFEGKRARMKSRRLDSKPDFTTGAAPRPDFDTTVETRWERDACPTCQVEVSSECSKEQRVNREGLVKSSDIPRARSWDRELRVLGRAWKEIPSLAGELVGSRTEQKWSLVVPPTDQGKQ
jgi:hypothetical protein